MSSQFQTDVSALRQELSSRWAPWWIYVLVLAPVNMGKELLLADDGAGWLRAGLSVIIVVGGIAVITAIYRATRDARIP